MNKQQAMQQFGFTDLDEFDTLLLDLGIDPETLELSSEQVEAIRQHVTVFASSLNALPPNQNNSHPEVDNRTYSAPKGSMAVVTNQSLQLAKEAGLEISQGALQTLCQMTFDKGRLDASFIENAYWLGLLRQQNQLRSENTEKFINVLRQQQNGTTTDLEKLVTDAGLLSNEALVKKLSDSASTDAQTRKTNLEATLATATNW